MSLHLEALTAGYGRELIVHGVNMDAPDGCVTVLIGPNGAGKSTILKALFGAAKVMGGSVFIDGSRCLPVTPTVLLRHGIAYVPQLRNVFPSLTVLENLDMGLGGARRESVDRVIELFPEIKTMLKREAGKLSGGQRNMVALGRALMGKPRTLLIDEGSAGLAPQAAQSYWNHLHKIVEDGAGVLVVEQDVPMALRHATHAYLLRGGEIALSGSGSDLATRDDLAAVFLGATVA
jgi:branched-chain amino acid transport system ATP-binding protein/neutral amino acid transport system ATP-binding protein